MRTQLIAPMVFLFLLGCTAKKEQQDDVAEIRNVYGAYMKALQHGDGARAAELADARTVEYYRGILDLARHADSTKVAGLDLLDRILVLGLRANSDRKELRHMEVREAMMIGSGSAMIGQDEMARMDLGTVSIEGDHASAPLTMYGFPLPASFHFNRENGQWKVDVTELFSFSRMAFEELARQGEGTDTAWIMELIGEPRGGSLDSLWHPLQ
jgi:hypothetical protein